MKLTKKVLSLILAAALLVGTVAVAANAADLLTAYEGSVQTYTMTADKTEVKPGETFTVTVMMDCNYYLGPVGCELILWTDGVFSALGDNYTTGTVANHYTLKPTNPAKVTSFPTAYQTGYTGVQFLRNYNASNVNVVMTTEEDNVLYTLTFTVNEDAAVGTVAKVFMPSESVLSASATGRTQMIYQAVNNASDAFSSGTNASKYAETVNCCSIDIKIVDDVAEEPSTEAPTTTEPTTEEPTTEEPTTEAPVQYADLTALQTAIANAATADTTNCTSASVAEFEAALAAANALNVEGTLASEQDAIDAAALRLENAITGLTKLGTVNYDALNDAIAAYEAKVADAGNYSNWAEYEALYNAAKEIDQTVVYDDENSSVQAAVDAAAAALNDFVLVEYTKVDYTALNDAIAAYEAKVADKDIYANWAEYEALYNTAAAIDQTVVYDKNGEQAAADAAAAALNDFVLVEYTKVDYTALNDAIAAYEAKVADKDIYANWAEYEALYNTAAAIDQTVVYDKNGEQAAVDAAASALANFQLEEKTLSYDKWNAAVAQIPADLTAYKPASVTAYETAKAAAEADKAAAVEALDQTALDAAADALTAAIALLEEKADKSALETAIARASSHMEGAFTPDSWAAADLANVLAAANVVLADGDATAEAVAEQVAAIEAAEAKLVEKADKAALLEALKKAQALNLDDYTPASLTEANLTSVVDEAAAVYADDNATAEEIAAQVAALNAAMAKLVEKADKTALEAAINTEVVLENATAETLAAYNEALAKAQEVYADDNATVDAVNAAEANLLAAIAGLDYYGACDYTAYDKAVADANALVADEYTTSSWTAADIAAVLAANAVEAGLLDKDGNQDKINAAAEAINAAIALLEKKADMTALQAAVDAEPTVAEDYATTETWTAYAQAKAEAEDILANAADTGVSAQAAVDAAAEALNAANAALVEETADYTAVEEAKALAAQQDLSDKTQASVKALEKALAAVVEGLGKSKQAEVDAMAQAINDAIAGLEVSKAAITNLEVDLSDYTAKESRSYTFTVTGEATKIRVISSSGVTATFDRYHRNVTIVSYDADGNVVDYATTAPAYEEWTVTLALGEGTYQAKAKFRNTWEAFTYEFDVDILDPADEQVTFVAKVEGTEDEAGKSISLTSGSSALVTVVAPSSAVKVQLVFSLGCTSTYTSANATVVDNGDGTSTWTFLRVLNPVGSYTMSLNIKDAGGWYAAVTDPIAIEVTK